MRLLPSAVSSVVVARLDAAIAAVSLLYAQQCAAVLWFSVSALLALLLGSGHRLFALSCLCFVAALAVSVFGRLRALSAALEEEQQQLHTVQQLLMAVKLEQERSGAEQKDATSSGRPNSSNRRQQPAQQQQQNKRPVANVLIDPAHFNY